VARAQYDVDKWIKNALKKEATLNIRLLPFSQIFVTPVLNFLLL
jgi:hypothetical protein